MFVQLNVGYDDENTFVFPWPDPPMTLGSGRVLSREVWRLQDSEAILGVEGTFCPLAVGGGY